MNVDYVPDLENNLPNLNIKKQSQTNFLQNLTRQYLAQTTSKISNQQTTT